MPALLVILVGIAVLGHAMMVRFMIDGAAYDAARTCALKQTPTTTCAKAVVTLKMGKILNGWCTSWTAVPKNTPQPGLTGVSSLEVRVTCVYRGVMANSTYKKAHGLNLGTLQARATMPY